MVQRHRGSSDACATIDISLWKMIDAKPIKRVDPRRWTKLALLVRSNHSPTPCHRTHHNFSETIFPGTSCRVSDNSRLGDIRSSHGAPYAPLADQLRGAARFVLTQDACANKALKSITSCFRGLFALIQGIFDRGSRCSRRIEY